MDWVVDPLLSLEDAESSGNAEVEGAANSAQQNSPFLLDGDAAPMEYEEAQKQNLTLQVYLEREYLWGPGDRGVDELLVQFDRTAARKPWWVIQDDGGDVVAVCDTIATGSSAGKGRVVQQLTYDAYGEALTSATLQPHPVLRCGHKGLFVDRLEVGVLSNSFIEFERIVPFAHILVQNRNRTYSLQVGRFLQADPNATGCLLVKDRGSSGNAPSADVDWFDLATHYRTGVNSFEYQSGNPWTRSDPTGLDWATDFVCFATELFVGGMRGGLQGIVDQYAANMEADIDWATDWQMEDDWHSRGENAWVGEAWRDGMQGGLQEVWDSYLDSFLDGMSKPVGPMGHISKAAKGAKVVKKIRTMKGLNRLKVYDSYYKANRAKKVSGDHTHHGVEQQMGGSWRAGVRKGGGPSVNVDPTFHLTKVRREFDKAYEALKIDPAKMSARQAKRVIDMVYKDVPGLKNECKKYIDGH